MKTKSVSIRNIAEELKISISTVSFVLNGKSKEHHISEKTANKVLDYAKLVNYKPNQIAQSLRTGKSKILVFMVEDISNNFFSKLARIFEDNMYDKGYKVIFCSNDNNDEKSRELIDLFNYRQVDGFIIVPSPGIRDVIESLIKRNIPVILLDRFFENLRCNVVAIDNRQACFDATSHLIKNKFNNIGFISTSSTQSQMADRLSGYQKAVSNFGLQPSILLVPYNEIKCAKEYIKHFLSENSNLDAVFFATNYLTQTGLEVFKENNYKLDRKLGIISFDDNDMFRLYPTSISCVSQPLLEMGNKLMELMLNLLNRKDSSEKIEKIILVSELVIRESSSKKEVLIY